MNISRHNTRDWFRNHPRMHKWMLRHNDLRIRLENWFGTLGFSVPLFPAENVERISIDELRKRAMRYEKDNR